MKAVIIDGTHRDAGNTAMLLEAFLNGLKSKMPDCKISHYRLIDTEFGYCRGCGRCMEDKNPYRGKCELEDKATSIITESIEADLLIFASPIYEYSVSSVLKKFLERCLPLATFKFGITGRMKPIKGKKGVIICCSGAPNPVNHLMGITRYPKLILKMMTRFFGCEKTFALFAGGMAINENIKKKELNKAYDLGIKASK